MENLRETLKILFHDTSVIPILNAISKNSYEDMNKILQGENKEFISRFSSIEQGFTLDQSNLVSKHLHTNWIKENKKSNLLFSSYDTIFNTILYFDEETLLEKNSNPICRYESLLRWNNLTSILTEDLFTTAFLAALDSKTNCNRECFTWPININHDNRTLNEIFKKEMIDLHFHLKGSSLNFDLNWLSLMNEVSCWNKNFNCIQKSVLNKTSFDYTEEKPNDLYLLIIKAAAIRLLLFTHITNNKTTFNKLADYRIVRNILISENIDEAIRMAKKLDLKIQSLRQVTGKEYKSSDGTTYKVDYATTDRNTQHVTPEELPLSVLSGERYVLYYTFQDIYKHELPDNEYIELMALFYAYILIKSKFRTEIIQSNSIAGFLNFSKYENRKTNFIKDNSVYKILLPQLAITSFLYNNNRYLEVRITPKNSTEELITSIKDTDADITDEHFMKKEYGDNLKKRYRYILHFIKKEDRSITKGTITNYRHYDLRKSIKSQTLAIHQLQMSNNAPERHRIVGIDAANSEIFARPEVFAQAFRLIRESHIINERESLNLGMTYHVGEDFYDIIDGIRAIDEVLQFMNFRNGDRLGHALVLGVDTESYYKDHHNNIIIPKQVAIDNLAWAYQYGRDLPSFYKVAREIEIKFEQLLNEMSLNEEMNGRISLWDYYQSWQLRGDNPKCYMNPDNIKSYETCSSWDKFNYNSNKNISLARENRIARYLYNSYQYSYDIRIKGEETIIVDYSSNMIEFIKEIQEKMITQIENRNISIECNPTSNLLIGKFYKYCTHPIIKFFNNSLSLPINKHSISVSINTDDKGVFSTSLEREYSLLALALEKEALKDGNCHPRDIYKWLDEIREMSKEQIFDYN